MVLDPLAEVGIGVLMAIMVGNRQLVMNIQRHGERRNGKQKNDEADRHSALKEEGQTSYGSVQSH